LRDIICRLPDSLAICAITCDDQKNDHDPHKSQILFHGKMVE
jgi:hypothetical protein